MRYRLTGGACLAAALLVGSVLAADAPKSGLKEGQSCNPFHPLNVTGAKAGQKNCLVWQYGNAPVAVVFAREVSDPLTGLVKKLEEATNKNKDLKSFVVFMSDDEGLEKKLKDFAKTQQLKNVVLAIDNPAGPPAYNIAKDADVTVLLYKNKKVAANRAYGKGQLNEQETGKVISDLPKIVPGS